MDADRVRLAGLISIVKNKTSWRPNGLGTLLRHAAHKLRPWSRRPQTDGPTVDMTGLLLTFPLVEGKVETWRRFCQELSGTRLMSYIDSRRRLGISHEGLTLVETQAVSLAEMSLIADDVERTLDLLAHSPMPFDVWYRERIWEHHGIGLADDRVRIPSTAPVLRRELMFEWALTGTGRSTSDRPRRSGRA